MPYRHITLSGEVVWWPERYNLGKKRLLLSADKTPMQNCWDIIKAVSLIFLAKKKLYARSYEDMFELESLVMFATFNKLKEMVRTGIYDRRCSFYLNVRSACLSVCQHMVDAWVSRVKESYKMVDGYGVISDKDNASLTLFDTLSDCNSTRLMTSSDYYSRHTKPVHWSSYARPSNRSAALRKETRRAYDDYCQECLLYNIDSVISYNEFVRKNYSDEEQAIILENKMPKKLRPGNKNAGRPRSKLSAEKLEARRAYYRDWYQRNKDRLSALSAQYRAQNRDKLKEYHREWYQKKKKAAD